MRKNIKKSLYKNMKPNKNKINGIVLNTYLNILQESLLLPVHSFDVE